MEQLDLQPIKDRLAAATQEEWFEDKFGFAVYSRNEKGCKMIATAFIMDGVHEEKLANRSLIANAPGDLGALIKEVERLRIELQLRGTSTASKTYPVFNEAAFYGDYVPGMNYEYEDDR